METTVAGRLSAANLMRKQAGPSPPGKIAIAVPSRVFTMLVGYLLLLGVSAQLLLFYGLRYEPPILVGGGIGVSLAGLTAYLSPTLLAGGAALLARRLRRLNLGWALLAAVLPCAILLLGIGLGVYLKLSPVSFD
jgi:hypothetical protein